MNPRLVKEWHCLRLPTGAAVVTALLPLAVKAAGPLLAPELTASLVWAATVVFVASIALMAAASFGSEFHHRTFGLLLAQPSERSRLWKEKLCVLCAGVVALVLLWIAQAGLTALLRRGQANGNLHFPRMNLDPGQMVAVGLFFLAVVCSAGYWTLLARSTIGGMAFSVVIPFVFLAILAEEVRKSQPDLVEARVLTICAAVTPLYSALFLWLGWRRFLRLELRDTVFSDSASLSGSSMGVGRWWGWLRCRPRGAGWNLARKEIWLLRPLLMVAAAFAAGWLPVAWLGWLHPREQGYDSLLFVLVCFYVPVTILLAGAMSLGEEKNLGMSDWQLTLPVSALRQWAIKLGVGFAAALLLGVVLPLILAWATLPSTLFNSFTPDNSAVLAYSEVVCMVFLLSFLAATVLRNTIQAALAAVVASVVLEVCMESATGLAGRGVGLQTDLLAWLIVHFQLAPDAFRNCLIQAWSSGVPVAVVIPVVAVLGLIQFRRPHARRGVFAKYGAMILVPAFLVTFWFADFSLSTAYLDSSRLVLELSGALRVYAAAAEPGNRPREVTVRDLEKKHVPLSPDVRTWLKGAVIRVELPPGSERVGEWKQRPLHATVALRSGDQCEFWYGTWWKGQIHGPVNVPSDGFRYH